MTVRWCDLSVSADTGDYAQLESSSRALGRVYRFGIEGTGSYRAGLTSCLHRCGHRIPEVNRGDRRTRRQNGKSDTLDAEAAARSVLASTATSIPKTADGLSEMIRLIKVARDTARKGKTSAIITLKQIIVKAPAELRESLAGLPGKALIAVAPNFVPRESIQPLRRPSTHCVRWPVVGSTSTPRSALTTRCSTTSPRKRHRSCVMASVSSPTARRRS